MLIDEAKHGRFHPCQEFFHHDLVRSVTEYLVTHHFLDGLLGVRFIFRDDNAFACRQTVGFQHHMIAEDAYRVQQLILIGELFVARRRDIMSCQEVLGE